MSPTLVVLDGMTDPNQESWSLDSVGLALQMVLDSLKPPERLAFMLHDVFGVPFAEIARGLDRSGAPPNNLPAVRPGCGASREPDADLERQRTVVNLFFAASATGTSRRSWRSSTPRSN